MENSLLLLAGLGVGAYLLTKKKTPVTTKDSKKEQEQKDKEDEEVKEEKKYLSLMPSRKTFIDQELLALPLKFDLDVNIPFFASLLDYSIWFKNNPKGLYQDWLTTMIYIQLAILEKRWDAETGELPLLLEPGKKLEIFQLDPPSYEIKVFPETPQQADQRLLQGRVLWLDINGYVKENMTQCPQGAFCG
jgi:hypothetical protein